MLLLTEGRMSDHRGGAMLLPALPPARELLADRGYDSNRFRAGLTTRGITPCYVLVGHSMGGKVLAGRPLPPELREQVIEDTLRGAAGAKRAWTERGMIEDVSAGLDRVTIPVTVLIGGRDQVEHETALRESFARFLPHATFRVLRRIGDLSPLEASDVLADACTVFLNEL